MMLMEKMNIAGYVWENTVCDIEDQHMFWRVSDEKGNHVAKARLHKGKFELVPYTDSPYFGHDICGYEKTHLFENIRNFAIIYMTMTHASNLLKRCLEEK